MADISGIEKVWGSAYENNRQHGDFRSKKGKHYSSQWDRIFYSLLSEMRNEELDAEVWEHDTEEFGHSIITGTMRRIHMCSKFNGLPVCDYYGVS